MSEFRIQEAKKHIAFGARQMGWTTLIIPLGFLGLSNLATTFPLLFLTTLAIQIICILILNKTCKPLLNNPTDDDFKNWDRYFITARVLLYFIVVAYVSFAILFIETLNWFLVFNLVVWFISTEMLLPIFAPLLSLAYSLLAIMSLPTFVFFYNKIGEAPVFVIPLYFIYFASATLRIRIQSKIFSEQTNIKLKEKESQEKLNVLIDALPVGLLWLDSNKQILKRNSKVESLFNLANPEGLTSTYENLPDSLRGEIEALLNKPLESNLPVLTFKWATASKDASHTAYQVNIQPYLMQNKQTMIILFNDMTTLQSVEEKLAEEREKAIMTSRLASLGEMSAGISHEIKNPLAIIAGNTSILKYEANQEAPNKESIKKRVTAIDSAIKRMAITIDSLQRLSMNTATNELKWSNLHQMLNNVLPLTSERMRLSSITFELDIPPNLELNCNALQIEQILLALITNSVDALKNIDQAQIIIHTRIDINQTLTIIVADNGPGVTHPEKLFTPFYTTKPPGSGTGLGLSLAQKLALQNGAEIQYQRQNNYSQFAIVVKHSNFRIGEKVA